jgi:hypothetical protein
MIPIPESLDVIMPVQYRGPLTNPVSMTPEGRLLLAEFWQALIDYRQGRGEDRESAREFFEDDDGDFVLLCEMLDWPVEETRVAILTHAAGIGRRTRYGVV